MKKKLYLALALLVLICGFGKSKSDSDSIKNNSNSNSEDKEIRQAADEMLASMTLEQKVCQMFIVTPEALTDSQGVVTADEMTRSKLQEHPVGGVIYFSNNLLNKEQTMQMLNSTQQYSMELTGLPVFLCVDEEGGRVARIGNNKGFEVPKVKPMGKITSKEEAYKAGNTIGSYLGEMGFNLDFAPDADVLTNKKNSVIGDRSFGSSADIVLSFGKEYSDGLHNNGVLSTFKHFPGHGATEADTHEGFAYTNKTYEELKKAELVPFAGAQKAGIDFVMVSHIAVPNVTGDNIPCSMSYKMVTEILRGDLGYDGLVVTDAMNMGAVAGKYSSCQAAVAAVNAGVDIVLMPKDFNEAVSGVIAAVESGEISQERIDEAVRRIITVKLLNIQAGKNCDI